MSTTTKTRRERFTPWCWEAERDEYNDESRRGWHLAKRTLRDMTYEYDPDAEYRYAIDYQHRHNEDRYLEFFEDDGWELVGTVVDGFNAYRPGKSMFVSKWDGCWYIFRKKYDPGQPATEYEIATDEESIREFKSTLTRKHRRLLIVEIAFFLYYIILHTTLDTWMFPDYIVLISTGLAALYAGYRLLCLNVFRPRKPIRLFIDFHYTAGFVLLAYIVALIVYCIITAPTREPETTVPVTTSNTPVQLFLDLQPDITVDEVLLLAEEYGLDVTSEPKQKFDGNGELYVSSYNIQLLPDTGLEYDPNNSLMFYRGVSMALVYDPTATALQSAYLSIDTDNGRAYCHYFPDEPTMENCETGYNLFLRKSALAPQKYYHADTPEEIIEIAYPVLYPSGLE